MAIIFGGTGWSAAGVDFTANAVPGGQTDFLDQSVYDPGLFSYFLNDSSGQFKLRPVAITQSWLTEGDGSLHGVLGTDLTVDAAQNLTGGIAQVLVAAPSSNLDAGTVLIGVEIAVADLIAAAATASRADDTRLLRAALAGNDLAGLSAGRDQFSSYGGIDLIFSNAGNDRLTLGAQMDAGVGGLGKDSISGGAGDDLLVGNEGRDVLSGGAGFDILDGGRGADRMTGGGGADMFVFLPGDGHDRITRFDAAEDILSFGVPGGALADVVVSTDGADALVAYHDNVIRLVGQAGLTLGDLDVRFGLHVSESRLESFVNFFDFKG